MNNFSSELQDLEKKLYDDIEKGITNILDRTCLILTEHPTWIPKLHRPREGYWDESAQPISYSDIPGHVDPRNLPYYISLHINDLYIGQDTTSISTDSIGTGIKNNETTMEQDRNDNKKLENCNGTSKQQEHQQKSQTISETSEECDGNVTSNRTKSTIIQQIYGPKGTNIQRTPSNAKEIHITSTNTNGHEQHMASSETRGNPRTTKRMGRSRSPSNGNRHGPRGTRRTPSETSENTRRSDDLLLLVDLVLLLVDCESSSLRLVFSDVSEGVRRVRRGPCLFPLDGDLDLPIRLVVRGFPRVSLLAICCSCPFVFVDVMCISFALLGLYDDIEKGITNILDRTCLILTEHPTWIPKLHRPREGYWDESAQPISYSDIPGHVDPRNLPYYISLHINDLYIGQDTTSISTDSIGTRIKNNETTMEQDRNDNKKLENCNGTSKQQEHQQKSQTISETSEECDGNVTSNRTKSTIIQQIYGPKGTNIQRTPSNAKEIHITSTNTNGHEQHMASSETRGNPRTTKRMGRSRSPSNGNRHGPRGTRRTPSETSENTRRSDDLLLLVDLVLLLVDCESSSLRLVFSDVSEGVRRVRRGPCLFPLDGDLDLPIRLVVRGFPRVSLLAICCSCPFVFVDVMCISFALLGLYDDIEKGITNILDRTCLILTEHPTWIPKLHRPREGYWDESAQPISYSDIPGHVDPRNLPYYISLHINDLYIGQDTTSISTDSIGTGIKNNETTMEQDRNDNKKLENCNGTSKQQEHQQKSQTISETSEECDGNVTSNRTKSTIIQQIYGPKGTNIQRTPSNAKEIHITSTNTNGHEQHMASSETRGNPRTTKRMGRSRSPSNGNRHGPRGTRRTPSETSENTRRSDDLLLLVDLVLLLVDCESSSLRLVFSDVSEGVRRVRRGPCLFPLDGDLDLPIRLVVRGFPRVSLLAICCSCPFVFVDVMCISFALLGLYDDIEKGITNILDRTCLILTEHPTWIPKLHRPREGYWDESAQPISYSDIPGHVDPRNLPYYISLHINDLYIGQDTTSISTDSIGTRIKNNETTMEQDRNDNKKLENCNGTSKQQEHQQKSQTISETSEECDGNVTSNRTKSTIIQQIYGPKGTNIQRTPSNAKEIHITSTNTNGHEQHMASSETRGNPRTTKRMGRSRSPSNGNRHGPRRTRRTPSETSENTRRSDDDSQSTRSSTRSTSSSKSSLRLVFSDVSEGVRRVRRVPCLFPLDGDLDLPIRLVVRGFPRVSLLAICCSCPFVFVDVMCIFFALLGLYDDIEKGITNILDRTCLILTEHPTWIPKLHRPREGYWDESAQPISYSDIPGHVDPRNLPYYISLHINDLYIGQDTTSISTDSIGTGIKNNETTMEQDRNDNKKLENCNGTSKQQEHQQKSQTISETSEECDGNVTSNRTKSTIIQQIYGPKGTNIQRTPSNAKEIHITSTNTNGHEQHMASSETRGNPRTTKRMGRSRSPSNGNRHGPRRTRRTPSETSENTRRSDDDSQSTRSSTRSTSSSKSSLRLVFSDVSEGVRRVRRGPCLFPLDGDLDLPIRLVVRGFPRVSLLAICCSCPFVFVDVMCIFFALLGLYNDIEEGITNILDRTCLILTEHPTWIPKLHRPREGYWDESTQPISYSDIPGHVDPRNFPYYISLHLNDLYIGQDTASISTNNRGTGIKDNKTTMESNKDNNGELEDSNEPKQQQDNEQESTIISETSEECDGNVNANRHKSTIIQQIYGPKGTNIQRATSNGKEIRIERPNKNGHQQHMGSCETRGNTRTTTRMGRSRSPSTGNRHGSRRRRRTPSETSENTRRSDDDSQSSGSSTRSTSSSKSTSSRASSRDASITPGQGKHGSVSSNINDNITNNSETSIETKDKNGKQSRSDRKTNSNLDTIKRNFSELFDSPDSSEKQTPKHTNDKHPRTPERDRTNNNTGTKLKQKTTSISNNITEHSIKNNKTASGKGRKRLYSSDEESSSSNQSILSIYEPRGHIQKRPKLERRKVCRPSTPSKKGRSKTIRNEMGRHATNGGIDILQHTPRKSNNTATTKTAKHRFEEELTRADTTEKTSNNQEPENEPNKQYWGHNLYTFIIHTGRHCRNVKRYGKKPDYVYITHGAGTDHEHKHFIFTSDNGNKHRRLNRICAAFEATSSELTEAIATNQLVEHRREFFIYLCRLGLRNTTQSGNGVQKWTEFLNDYKQFETQEETLENGLKLCQQITNDYRRQRKEELNEKNDSKTHTYANNLQAVTTILNKYKPMSHAELVLIPAEEKYKLYELYGPASKSQLTAVFDIWQAEQMEKLRTTKFLDILEERYPNPVLNENEEDDIDYIFNIFRKSGIHFLNFLAGFIYIYDKHDHKKNAFVIQGKPNTGKTMLINMLLGPLHPCRLAKTSEGDRFHFSRLPSSPSVLYEEPFINMLNINLFKSALGGEPMETDVKHAHHQNIVRIPWFLTTNHDITRELEGVDREAINCRIVKYELTGKINDGNTILNGIPQHKRHIKPESIHKFIIVNREFVEDAVYSYRAIIRNGSIPNTRENPTKTRERLGLGRGGPESNKEATIR
ncbi:hypothetical protein Pmani_000756 [Petrolisthes manimaculis]|uniref:SF3 helicase domain-containing protein n=1 Tax=Petrolisthes manimaculis TaxID=1843537 RepID=A0AAE1UQ12_9EUCA|nr:hypothetical protein Pmani_000756 [Petrolisthes manimaculis]